MGHPVSMTMGPMAPMVTANGVNDRSRPPDGEPAPAVGAGVEAEASHLVDEGARGDAGLPGDGAEHGRVGATPVRAAQMDHVVAEAFEPAVGVEHEDAGAHSIRPKRSTLYWLNSRALMTSAA